MEKLREKLGRSPVRKGVEVASSAQERSAMDVSVFLKCLSPDSATYSFEVKLFQREFANGREKAGETVQQVKVLVTQTYLSLS